MSDTASCQGIIFACPTHKASSDAERARSQSGVIKYGESKYNFNPFTLASSSSLGITGLGAEKLVIPTETTSLDLT